MSNPTNVTGVLARVDFTDDQLRAIDSFDAALALAGPLESVGDYLGTGFKVLPTDEKNKLVGQPFVILGWDFHESDKSSDPFVSILVVTKTGEKFVLNDGGTGIRRQMQSLGESRPFAVPAGLTRSDFYYNETTGEVSNKPKDGYSTATTYYLSEN